MIHAFNRQGVSLVFPDSEAVSVSEMFHIQSIYCFNFPQILHKPHLYLILKQYSIMDNVRKVEDTIRWNNRKSI